MAVAQPGELVMIAHSLHPPEKIATPDLRHDKMSKNHEHRRNVFHIFTWWIIDTVKSDDFIVIDQRADHDGIDILRL
jgi:hypothetical protein